MKLSKLYSNKDDLFEPIAFHSGLNVVLAEIRLPENLKKDTHNLGKTTLGRLIDYCLLASRDNSLFLFKHYELFSEFVFFLEIELSENSYVTIRRSVEENTKISFKKHDIPHQDFTETDDAEWDHIDLPLERATDLLDGILDLQSLKPWSYRKGLGYFLRSQDDYGDVFQLRRFAGSHADWKPYLANMLGFNSSNITNHYAKEIELKKKEEKVQTIKTELGGTVEDVSKIEGILLLKNKEAEKKQKYLAAFDFRTQDKEKTKTLVNEIDERISELNSRRYSLLLNKKKIVAALETEQILFDPTEVEFLFKEAGVLFQGQIKKDFEQLIAFNTSITEERKGYLQSDKTEIESKVKLINTELNELGKKRSELLSFLSDTDVFNKYKSVSDELVKLKTDIAFLEKQREYFRRIHELRAEIRSLSDEKGKLQNEIEADVEAQNSDSSSFFASVRVNFNEIVEEVIDRKALLSVSTNQQGHLDFKAEILDESGNITSASDGHTYRKLICIAFDMALLKSHLSNKFPLFAFHDGVFESLDDRKKENLLSMIRKYSDLGIQQIITLIDSDLPARQGLADEVFGEEEIVLKLHDEDDSGRLFKTRSW